MGHLRYVTLTGAGEATDFADIQRLSHFSWVEWGVLYSLELAGRHPRYPSLEWLENFADKANAAGLNIAIHLCGGATPLLLKHAETRFHLPSVPADVRRLINLVEKFGRVQLNVRAKNSDVHRYRALVSQIVRSERRTRVILQWKRGNEFVCQSLAHTDGFEVLVDSSGGRGLEPAQWPTLSKEQFPRVGYAGGLGPDELRGQLLDIDAAAGDRMYWVDMEGKLRTKDDQFNLAACEKVLLSAKKFVLSQERAAGALHGVGKVPVSELEGFWLDWWVAEARNLDSLVPPLDARRAMLFDRQTGAFLGYCPSEDPYVAKALFEAEQIAVAPTGDQWDAYPVTQPDLRASGRTMAEAGLRAIVRRHFGAHVTRNPML